MEKITVLQKRIEEKCKERDELMKKLERSLAIKQMWDNPVWPVTPYITGSPSKGFYFFLEDATKAKKKFTIDEIPDVLRKAPNIEKALDYIDRWK